MAFDLGPPVARLREGRIMSNRHEPGDVFVAQLEERPCARNLRVDRLAAPAPRWVPRTTRGLVFATAALVVVSMAVGGGAVSAAYQAQQGAQRDALVKTHVLMVDLAARRLALARHSFRTSSRRVRWNQNLAAVNDARFKVTEAETEMRLVELDLAEVRASGRDPGKTVSAPLVSGRTSSPSGQVEATVPAAALDVASGMSTWPTRFDVGLANNQDFEMAGSRLIEVEGESLAQRELASGRRSEARADGRRGRTCGYGSGDRTATRDPGAPIAFSRRQLQDVKLRTEIGTAGPVELAEAELRLQELQLALTEGGGRPGADSQAAGK